MVLEGCALQLSNAGSGMHDSIVDAVLALTSNAHSPQALAVGDGDTGRPICDMCPVSLQTKQELLVTTAGPLTSRSTSSGDMSRSEGVRSTPSAGMQ